LDAADFGEAIYLYSASEYEALFFSNHRKLPENSEVQLVKV
jgi:hypothetical protein